MILQCPQGWIIYVLVNHLNHHSHFPWKKHKARGSKKSPKWVT